MRFSWVNDKIYTKRNGKAVPIGTEAGIYSVKIDTDKLNATLSQDKNNDIEKFIRIAKGKTTTIEFPLKSCVGNITGTLQIKDDFNREKQIDEFIVVLNDEEGKEIAYSTVNSNGDLPFQE